MGNKNTKGNSNKSNNSKQNTKQSNNKSSSFNRSNNDNDLSINEIKQYFILKKDAPSHVIDELLKIEKSNQHSLGLANKRIFSTRLLRVQNYEKFQVFIGIIEHIQIYNGKQISFFMLQKLLALPQTLIKINFQNLISFSIQKCNLTNIQFVSSLNAESLQVIIFNDNHINSLKPFAKTNFKCLRLIMQINQKSSKSNSLQFFNRTKLNPKFTQILHLSLFDDKRQQHFYSLFKLETSTILSEACKQSVQQIFKNKTLQKARFRRF